MRIWSGGANRRRGVGSPTIRRHTLADQREAVGTNVDAYLTGHIGVLMKRFLLRLPNRDGKTTGLDDILGLGVLANDPEQRIKLVRGRGTDQITPQLLYRSQRIQSEDGKETVRITVDERQAADLGKIIERTLRREGRPPLSEAELQAKIAELKDQMRTLEQPSVRHDLKVDLVKYHNAILKIAYEFAWLWLGDAYLEDPVAVKLRRKILENADEQIGGVIQIGTTVPFDTMWTGAHGPAAQCHEIVVLARLAGPAEIGASGAKEAVVDAIAFQVCQFAAGRLTGPRRPWTRPPNWASKSTSPTRSAKLASRQIRTFTQRAGRLAQRLDNGAVCQPISRHVDLLRRLAEQGEVDRLEVLAGPVMDLRGARNAATTIGRSRKWWLLHSSPSPPSPGSKTQTCNYSVVFGSITSS
jgi:hypothetical protein